jgi:hypothetical protein
MNSTDWLIKLANLYEGKYINKFSFIRKLPNNKYRVMSEKGKNLGTYDSEKDAKKRLKQIEFFKHDKSKSDDAQIIDLSDVDDFTYSAVMRKIRKNTSKEQTKEFISIFKKYFDQAIINEVEDPEKIALKKTLDRFNEMYSLKIDENLVKNAAISELGNPVLVGKYLADIIRFTLNRISPEKRPKALNSVKNKIYALNENDIANKNLPASSSMGQSITFVKTILFNHNPKYIRNIINNIVRNL